MAPVLSFLSEEVSDYYQGKQKTCSVHLQDFVKPPLVSYYGLPEEEQPRVRKMWQCLKKVRGVVMKALEEQRKKKLVKSSLEASLVLQVNLTEEEKDKEEGQLLLDLLALEEKNNTHNTHNTGTYDYRLLQDYFVVSEVQLSQTQHSNHNHSSSSMEGEWMVYEECAWLRMKVKRAGGGKCERCWRYFEEVTPPSEDLCCRCRSAVVAQRQRQSQD